MDKKEREKLMKENPIRLGLKDNINYLFIKENRSWRWFGKYSKSYTLWWDIRYAIQRAWRGYDFIDTISTNSVFIERMCIVLKEMTKNIHGYPDGMEFDEWKSILKQVRYTFERWYLYDTGCCDFEEKEYLEIKDKALGMFVKYFENLWD